MSTDDLLLEELDRIQFDYEENDVAVKCIKPLEIFEIGEKRYKLIQGATMKLPFWIADILEKEGYVSLIEDFERNIVTELRRISMSESDSQNVLQKIDKEFYLTTKHILRNYSKKSKFISDRDKESIIISLREIMDKRLKKIMKMAEKGREISTKVRNLTPEEKWLLDFVAESIEKWQEIMKESSTK